MIINCHICNFLGVERFLSYCGEKWHLNHLKAAKGPVNLIKRVKIAHSFLQSASNQFHFIILSLPMKFYIWLPKNFSDPTS